MSNISLPSYDGCRRWITEARSQNIEWERIKYALKSNENDLHSFLEQQKINSFWPADLNVNVWLKIVDSEMEAETKSLAVTVKDRKAVLIDDSQDSEVTVPENERSSWQLYKAHLIESGWKQDSIEEIEKATIGLLKRLNSDTAKTDPVKGLVIGHVQSGKTANMAALMAMAADWGWNLFVVLSGTIENLRKQTQSRLFRDLNRPGNINWIGLEHLSKKSPAGQRTQDLRLEETSTLRYFTVCLKNASRLKNLIEWMQQDPNKHKQMKVIVIDDEADQASINTADISLNERARINQLIVNLVEGKTPKGEACKTNVKSMNYISYTATPYANFLNESTPESLYPKNFIRTLQPSNEYFGPRQIFGVEGTDDCDGLNIIRVIDEDDLELLKALHNGEVNAIPDSLKKSISWFLCAAAAMRVFGYSKPISMLVHTSQKQQHHQQVSEEIQSWLLTIDRTELIGMCEKIWGEERKELTIKSFRESFADYGRVDDEINDYPKFSEIAAHIEALVEDITNIPLNEDGELQYQSHIHLCVDNCANNGVNEDGMFVRLAYPDPEKKPYPSPAPAFIIVGGSTLSRGLTIEGLVSTYFLRSSCQADSLMQMGRWFGYRKGYELLPRIWMSEDTLNKFKFLAVLEAELREDLRRFMDAGANPQEYGPRVKNTPKVSWLRVTAKNRMQGAEEIEMDFTGTSSQTIIFDNDASILKHNIDVTEKFINRLGAGEISHLETALVWQNIEFTQIMEELLKDFKFHRRSRVFNELDAFAEWVKKVSFNQNLSNWNIIAAGLGKVNQYNEKSWLLTGGSVGKINRSRKKGYDENTINIGVLRAPKDLLADVDPQKISQTALEKINTAIAAEDVELIRTEAGLERTPQLIIYRIAKDSTARQKTENREDLNAAEDIIGLCISIPGVKPRTGIAGALTVKINKDRLTVDENWGDEE